MLKKLLCLSNGHGEDAIAVAILQQLPLEKLEIVALPLVGQGYTYTKHHIPLIGSVESLPSGGFIYMDGGQLWQDLQSGLVNLTLQQYHTIKQWVKQNAQSQIAILAVGDILPLLLAWLTGVNYAFIGTAKSEYYLRDEQGWYQETSLIERSFGSMYYPWERWLMSSPRCRGVFPRDHFTATILQKYPIPVFDYGNPMMDFNQVTQESTPYVGLSIVLLPGSRPAEAQRNWSKILLAVTDIINTINEPILFLLAIAPNLDLKNFTASLDDWEVQGRESIKIPAFDSKALVFQKKQATLVLTQDSYPDCLYIANFAIAMAGTATEQFVGLGKPAIAMPGEGPQYTRTFAKAQTRLLGPSLILVEKPAEIAPLIMSLRYDSQRLQKIAANGQHRLGKPGAAKRIAQCLWTNLFFEPPTG
jgi:uncharacterized protein (TIGR03492 family)